MEKGSMCGRIKKITIFMAFFLLVIALFFNYFSYEIAKSRLIEGYSGVRTNDLRSRPYMMQNIIEGQIDVFRAKYPSRYDGQEFKSSLNELMQPHGDTNSGFVKGILYINEEGISELSTDVSWEGAGEDYSGELFFYELKAGKPIFIQDGGKAGGREIIFSVPVLADDGSSGSASFKGAFLVRLDAEKIFDLVLGPINSKKTPEIAAVLNNDGVLIYHHDKKLVGINYKDYVIEKGIPSSIQLMNSSLEGKEGYGTYSYPHSKGEYIGKGNVKKVVVYAPMDLGEIRWSLWVTIPVEELEKYSGFSQVMMLILFNMFMIIVFFAIIVSTFFLLCSRII